MGGAYTAQTAVVSPPRCGLSRGSSDNSSGVLTMSLSALLVALGLGVGDDPVRTAVGFSSPHSGVPLSCRGGGAQREDGGGGLAASSWCFPCICKWHQFSEDGGGAHATSAGPQPLSLGFFEDVQAARTAVGILLPCALLSLCS